MSNEADTIHSPQRYPHPLSEPAMSIQTSECRRNSGLRSASRFFWTTVGYWEGRESLVAIDLAGCGGACLARPKRRLQNHAPVADVTSIPRA